MFFQEFFELLACHILSDTAYMLHVKMKSELASVG